jgi:hypothetical protein
MCGSKQWSSKHVEDSCHLIWSIISAFAHRDWGKSRRGYSGSPSNIPINSLLIILVQFIITKIPLKDCHCCYFIYIIYRSLGLAVPSLRSRIVSCERCLRLSGHCSFNIYPPKQKKIYIYIYSLLTACIFSEREWNYFESYAHLLHLRSLGIICSCVLTLENVHGRDSWNWKFLSVFILLSEGQTTRPSAAAVGQVMTQRNADLLLIMVDWTVANAVASTSWTENILVR